MVKLCNRCGEQRAALRRPKTFEQLCKQCFYTAFEEEIHETIVTHNLFSPGERVAVAASGGKDSTVLAHVLTTLNRRHNYGLDLFLLSIDEGISGYRDDSLETVKRNEAQYGIPLHVFSYKDLYGWTMDEIVAEVGTKSNCTFCGVFRRQALDRGATLLKADKVGTGHNADDVAETVLLNLLRGDVPRLGRCASIITGGDSPLPRVKPFKFTYEKEIVMYAYFQKLDYFCTECIYAPFAARGAAREFVKDLEAARPRAIIDLIRSAEQFRVPQAGGGGAAAAAAAGAGAGGSAAPSGPQPGSCVRCGYLSSQDVCKACQLLEGLNKGLPRLGISRTRPGGSAGRANGRKSAAAPAGTAGAAGAASTADAAAAAAVPAASAGSKQQQGCGAAACACMAAGSASQAAPPTICSSTSAGAAALPAAASAAAAGCCQQRGAQGGNCSVAEQLATEQRAAAGEADQQQQAQQCGEAGGEGGGAGLNTGAHSYLLSKSSIAAHPSARTLAYE